VRKGCEGQFVMGLEIIKDSLFSGNVGSESGVAVEVSKFPVVVFISIFRFSWSLIEYSVFYGAKRAIMLNIVMLSLSMMFR